MEVAQAMQLITMGLLEVVSNDQDMAYHRSKVDKFLTAEGVDQIQVGEIFQMNNIASKIVAILLATGPIIQTSMKAIT